MTELNCGEFEEKVINIVREEIQLEKERNRQRNIVERIVKEELEIEKKNNPTQKDSKKNKKDNDKEDVYKFQCTPGFFLNPGACVLL